MLFSFCECNEIAAVNGNQDRCLAPLPSQSCAFIRCQSAQTRPTGSNMRLCGSYDTALLDESSLDGHLSLTVIRSSDYVFANSTQIRGSIPGEDDFVMAWKA